MNPAPPVTRMRVCLRLMLPAFSTSNFALFAPGVPTDDVGEGDAMGEANGGWVSAAAAEAAAEEEEAVPLLSSCGRFCPLTFDEAAAASFVCTGAGFFDDPFGGMMMMVRAELGKGKGKLSELKWDREPTHTSRWDGK